MSIRTRVLEALGLALLAVAGGTIAYMMVEDLAFSDAIYLTVITISTVGFAEPAGGFSSAGQIATIIIIVFGVGTVLYAATTAIEFAVEEILGGAVQARREKRRLKRMRGHTIICGFGRIGRHVYQNLDKDHRQVVVIESHEAPAEVARELDLVVIDGDATDDSVLREAGIADADVVIAVAHDDPTNLTIVLSARALRPDLRIVARANESQTESKLVLAGADRVVTPSIVGAVRMAQMANNLDLADFVDIRLGGDLLELQIEECTLAPTSQLVGHTLAASGIREHSGAMVIAVVSAAGERIINPEPGLVLGSGQSVTALGTAEQVISFRALTV